MINQAATSNIVAVYCAYESSISIQMMYGLIVSSTISITITMVTAMYMGPNNAPKISAHTAPITLSQADIQANN